MAERRLGGGRRINGTDTLLYGHLGTATYDQLQHQWLYLRQNLVQQNENALDGDGRTSSIVPSFEPLRAPVIYSEDSLNVWNAESLANGDGRVFDHLISHQPELIIASVPIEKDESSHSHNFSALGNRSMILNSMVIGSALLLAGDILVRVTRTCPIIALTAGESSENVQIFSLRKSNVLVQVINNQPEEIWVPTTSRQITTTWKSTAEKVVKMCFTRQITTFSEKPLLAVLKPSCTTFLQPEIHDTNVGQLQDVYRENFGRGACIDANPVISLPSSRTGGHLQADIAFNSDEMTNFAIVDVHGNWSIWGIEILSKHMIDEWNLHLLNSGKIVTRQKGINSKAPDPYYDGWHRVLWVRGWSGQLDLLFVCNRRSGAVFDTEKNLVTHMDMRLNAMRPEHWVIDIEQGVVQQHLYYVLTSTQLIVFKSPTSDEDYHPESQSITYVCSWNHFRNQSDYEMKIALLELAEVTYVFLYSKANVLVTVFSFTFGGVRPANIFSKADPVLFELPDSVTEHHAVEDLTIQTIQEDRKTSERTAFVSQTPFLLFVRMRTGAVIELLYTVNSTSEIQYSEVEGISHLPWPKYAQSQTKFSRVNYSRDSGLIVADDQWDLEELKEKARKKPRESMIVPAHLPVQKKQIGFDFTPAMNKISELVAVSSLTQAVQDADSVLQNMRPGWHQQLLGDLMKFPSISDIDTDSDYIRAWVQSRKDTNLRIFQITGEIERSVLDTYTELFELYVHSLDENLPEIISVNYETVCEQVALDVYLASLTIRPKFSEQTQDFASKEIYALEGSRSSLVPSLQAPSSQSLLPQLVSSSSGVSEPPSNAISRLSMYTNFKRKTAKSQPELESIFLPGTEASQIFAHFPPSVTDPSTYSYTRTLETVTAFFANIQAQALDPKARRRLERNAARQKRQQERQDRLSQAVSQQLSHVPGIMSGNQAIPERQIQSSQIVPSAGFSQGSNGIPKQMNTTNEENFMNIMTQPERGEFGTRNRDVRKPGKKKRKQGF